MSGIPAEPLAPDQINAPTGAAVKAQLSRILNSAGFSRSERLKHFLTFVVEQYLEGKADQAKETSIAVTVFGKKPDFDPSRFAIVRTTANRLRKELANYYNSIGGDDLILIELPIGSYVPRIVIRTETKANDPTETLADISPPAVRSSSKRTRLIIAATIVSLVILGGTVFFDVLAGYRSVGGTGTERGPRAKTAGRQHFGGTNAPQDSNGND